MASDDAMESAESVPHRVRERLSADLQLDAGDVEGVMAILDEELSWADHAADEWACDVCGERKSVALHPASGQRKCRRCIFGDD